MAATLHNHKNSANKSNRKHVLSSEKTFLSLRNSTSKLESAPNPSSLAKGSMNAAGNKTETHI